MPIFGEISLPSSRAIWEDFEWDDVVDEYHLPELQWQIPLEIPEEVNKLVLLEGKYLWDGLFISAQKKMHKVNSVKEANLHLFKAPDANNYICVIKDGDLMLICDVLKLLKDLITKAKKIVTIQIKPISEYVTAETIVQSCIIKKIITTNSTNLIKANYPKLEQPNIISGVAAGVFTLREHLCLSATALMIYMEHSPEYVIDDIDNLLKNLDISKTGRIYVNTALNSNLYI